MTTTRKTDLNANTLPEPDWHASTCQCPECLASTARMQKAANKLTNKNRDNNVEAKEQPAHIPSGNMSGLLLRESLARDFLTAMLRAGAVDTESFRASENVRRAFSHADEFITQANHFRDEAEMEGIE